jgi:hypothetical protein
MGWKKEDVLAFRDRDWSAFERAPVTRDPQSCIRLAGSLHAQVRHACPDWPTDDERAADLDAHVRLSETFRRIFDAQRSGRGPR